MWGLQSYAQVNVPESADAGRVTPPVLPAVPHDAEQVEMPSARQATADIPPGAEAIRFTLKSVSIEGATAFTQAELETLYAQYLHKEVHLGVAWIIAAAITEQYQKEGYVLSRAYVPQQEIDGGRLKLKVVEGYIGEIEIDPVIADHIAVSGLLGGLKDAKPIKAAQIESALLHLNDLPGLSFRAVLAKYNDKANRGDGAIKLSLIPQERKGTYSIAADNHGSRYLGPYQATAGYQGSIIPMHQTTISGLSSIPADELKFLSFSHAIPLWPRTTLDVAGIKVSSSPGFRLKPYDINGTSSNLSAGINYRAIRQRTENLTLRLGLDGKNTASDSLGTPLMRDRVRAVRTNISYDTVDPWRGYDIFSLTLSHGLEGLGARNKGALNLSRREAVPDFKKAELFLMRLHDLGDGFTLTTAFSGQYASDPLFSSEEFGYGGQNFGRAYDASEITGDHGAAASLELRYRGLDEFEGIAAVPYAFYDIGRVWNEDSGQTKPTSGASAGFGIKFTTKYNLSADIGVAFPLTREVETPIYSEKSNSPRYLMRISYSY